jgi:hypothetical protein
MQKERKDKNFIYNFIYTDLGIFIERLRKQSSRQNNPVRNKIYNKAIKRDKRKSTEYIQHESNLKKKKLQGTNIEQCIRQFEKKISVGPVYRKLSSTWQLSNLHKWNSQ